jgi:hypothetical protein
MKRKKLRRMIRKEIRREMYREEGVFDSVRATTLGALKQLGFLECVPPKDRAN